MLPASLLLLGSTLPGLSIAVMRIPPENTSVPCRAFELPYHSIAVQWRFFAPIHCPSSWCFTIHYACLLPGLLLMPSFLPQPFSVLLSIFQSPAPLPTFGHPHKLVMCTTSCTLSSLRVRSVPVASRHPVIGIVRPPSPHHNTAPRRHSSKIKLKPKCGPPTLIVVKE